MTAELAPRSTDRLTHHVTFRATPEEASAALTHYTIRFAVLGLRCSSTTSPRTSEQPFTSQTTLVMGGDTTLTATLTICPPGNPRAAEPDAYEASIVISEHHGDPDLVSRLYLELDRLPLTGTELADLRRQFPLSTEFARSMRRESMSSTAFYMSIHHMGDFVSMMDAMVAMGADPKQMTILDKGYPYLQRERVDGWLRYTLGVQVDFYRDRVASVGSHIERMKKAGLRTLIIDDGGYTWPVVAEHYPNDFDQFVGIVEQTMSGIWKLAGHPVPVPVFSVAESRLKATIEPYGVAAAAVRSIVSRIPHEKLEGRPALLLGYGRIGKQVAYALRNMRMRVAVHDTDQIALVTAHEEGFETGRDLGELIERHQPLLVCGNAGRASLRREHLKAFKRSAYLASGTSRTYEFDLEAFAAAADEVVDYGILGHGYKLPHGVELCVLGHGMPVNFYYAESLPNRYIDMVFASLLLGATTLLQPDQGGFQPGHNVALTDEVLDSSAALVTYYKCYGERSAEHELLTPAGRPFTGIPWTFDA